MQRTGYARQPEASEATGDNNTEVGRVSTQPKTAEGALQRSIEDLTEGVSALSTELKGQVGEVARETAEQVTRLEGVLEEHKAQLVKLEERRSHLSGVEYDKDGNREKQAFSLWRMVQLAAHASGSSKSNPAVWDRPEYGYEVEVMRTAQNIASDADGGHFMPSELMTDSIIPLLEAESILAQLGSPQINGLQGEVSWLYTKTGHTAYYVDTEDEEAITQSAMTWASIKASPHVMGTLNKLTWGALNQTAFAMESMIRQDMANKFALRVDLSGFLGTGSASQPKGLLNYAQGTGDRQVQTVSWSSDDYLGADQNITDLAREMHHKLRLANVPLGGAALAWAAEPDVEYQIGNTKDADGKPLFLTADQLEMGRFMGKPMRTSTQLTNATTTAARLIYGDWKQLLRLGFGDLEVRAGETGTDLEKARITIRGLLAHDCIVLQPKAFVSATSLAIN